MTETEMTPFMKAMLLHTFMTMHNELERYEKALVERGYPQSTIDVKMGESRAFVQFMLRNQVQGTGPRVKV